MNEQQRKPPAELDVPHWASSMVANYRSGGQERLSPLPAYVTDRMIFARVEECCGMDHADIEAAVRELIEDAAP